MSLNNMNLNLHQNKNVIILVINNNRYKFVDFIEDDLFLYNFIDMI